MTGAAFEAALRRVGTTVFLVTAQGETSFCASIQPVLALGGEEFSPLGVGRSSRANLYAIAGESPCLTMDDRIRAGDSLYRVLQVETHTLGGAPVYLWAMLQRWESS